MELDGAGDRYAVRHADTGQLICRQEGQVGAGLRVLGAGAKAAGRHHAAAAVLRAKLPGAAAPQQAQARRPLQEAANEVADLCAAKLALERGIPLEAVAFKHDDALQHIGPGAEVGKDECCWVVVAAAKDGRAPLGSF